MFWAGGMVHVAEHLPSKHEALSSNPGVAKKMFKNLKNSLSSSKQFF
jgi:hypothetical protein